MACRSSLLLLLLLVALLAPALACTADSIAVALAGEPAAPISPAAFDESQVRAHFANQLGVQYQHSLDSPFFCVDSRSEVPALRSPGGDFVEVRPGPLTQISLYAR